MESGQHWARHRGRLEKWEFPFFSCSPWERAETKVKDLLGFSGHLAGGRAGWRAGRGWSAGQLSPLWDPAIWKQTPCLPVIQPTTALPRTMAGYRPAFTSNSYKSPGQAGLASAKQGLSLAHRGPAASTSNEGTQVQPGNVHPLAPREAPVLA